MHEAVTDLVGASVATECTDRNSQAIVATATTPIPRLCLTNATSSELQAQKHLPRLLRNQTLLALTAARSIRPTSGSPRAIIKEAKSRLLRNQNHRGSNAAFCNLTFPLQFRFRLFWIRWHKLSKCLAHAHLCRDVGDRGRSRDNSLCLRGLRRDDRRDAGIENNALRPFPIGMNPYDRQIGIRPVRNRQLRQNCIDNKQQREQNPADKEKIPCQGHLSIAPSAPMRGSLLKLVMARLVPSAALLT